ncbi:MAG: DUF4830 domain-containing protein [Oscillospiraceae bacterium]|nr:DUF4830 domain-containing protein [Oscillospiraceae bacterium]
MKKFLKYLFILPPAVLCCVAIILSHQKKSPAVESISVSSEAERSEWLMLQGWNAELLTTRLVTVPAELNEFCTDYALLQSKLRLPFAQYAGKHGVLYTYRLENSALYAELLTADGVLVGAQCYHPEQHKTLDMQGRNIT